MAGVPSVGDILLLSQIAWKIGYAFTSGRNGAPAEFQEVENELNGLTNALTLLAEAFDEDDSLIARADQNTRDGLEKILDSCKLTLESLASFVARYQEIRKPSEEESGLTQRRSWKRILTKNYKTISWTGEGGNIQSLRNMLQMHVSSISLTMQALQSKSLSRLENTIKPMADKVDDIHSQLNGDLNIKIDEIHHLMLSMAVQGSPILSPKNRESSIGNRDIGFGQFGHVNTTGSEVSDYSEGRTKYPLSPEQTPELKARDDPNDPNSIGRALKQVSPISKPVPSYAGLMPVSHEEDELPQYERIPPKSQTSFSARNSRPEAISLSPGLARPTSEASDGHSPLSPTILPPAAMTDQDQTEQSPAHQYPVLPPSEPAPALLSKTMTTVSQQEEFRRSIFLDSAVLCDVKGTCVEYTQPDNDNPPALKMVKAMTDCRLLLVTKRRRLSAGGMRFTTSIWALSDDRSVRMQQELPDGEEVVPYTVWGNLEKVVLRLPTELKFHDIVIDAKPTDVATSSWVNYVFADERASAMFQSALMGKSLLLSVKTNKTLRMHDGIIENTFSYQEQMCALENLRIWQDPDTGGVLAMTHYSAHFRDGYLAFYLNSARDPIRLREEGDKWVKVKGLSILPPPKKSKPRTNTDLSKASKEKEKRIKGAKIEFTSDEDRQKFMAKVREVQGMFYAGEI